MQRIALWLVIEWMRRKYLQKYFYYINIVDYIETIAYRKKLTPDLESVAKNYIESVKKSRATENEKKNVDQCYLYNMYLNED